MEIEHNKSGVSGDIVLVTVGNRRFVLLLQIGYWNFIPGVIN